MTRMFGRDLEAAQLREVVAKLAGGHGGVAWLEGEPGIGKSALVDAMTRDAQAVGCRVLRASGDELMRAFPLRMMADALDVGAGSADPVRQQIAGLLRGEPVQAGTLDPVLAAGERMLALVDRLCAEQPLLLVLEDVHWADEPSLLLCHRLSRAVDQIPLLLVLTSRPVAARTTAARMRTLVRERPGAHLDLEPLTAADTAALATRLAGGLPGPRLRAELARAGGNPLYLREMIEALVRDKALEGNGPVRELRADVTTTAPSLVAAITRRLDSLSEPTVRTLRLAALLRREFDAGHWSEVSGRPMTELAAATEEAVAAGVLAAAGERLTFRHDVIRQVLADQLPVAVRHGLHRHAARALAQLGAGVDEVSPHLLATSGQVDGWALTWLAGLPEAMLYAAPDVAVELLVRATAPPVPADELHDTLSTRLALALFWLGRDEQACQVAEQVLHRTADPARETRLRILAIRAAGRMRRFEHALALTRPAGQLPPQWQARLQAWRAMILAFVDRLDEAAAEANGALDSALACGDSLAVGYAHNTLAYLAPAADQLCHIDAAIAALGDDVEATDLKMLLSGNRLHRLLANGRRDELEASLAEALVRAEQVGSIRAGIMFAQAAGACYAYGRWDDAVMYADRPDQELLATPALSYLHAIVALIAMHRDDHATADARLHAAGFLDPAAQARWVGAFGVVAEAVAMHAETGGDLTAGLAVRASYLDLPPGPARASRSDEAILLVRAALALGDRSTADAAAAAVEADPDPAPDRLLAIRCCRAMLAGDPAELLATAGEYEHWGWLPRRAFALEEAAVLLAGRGDQTGARAAFTEALGTWLELGATWETRRAEARLRPFGIRRGPRTVRRRPAHGWDALTPSERHVARLVAKGLSNPDIAAELFVSRNTVQTHVSRVLSKLQMRSRIELIQQAADGDRAG
ncbi:SARP family transcriptional regulator [Catellatospora citrea]|uniref:SARP family transcriptional regulator n=2 Tax=Catellatospora citrea TaxID=53366 RepID=A0A8J3KJ35_9ACTN|nr:SARP family transcriptional regulator [Catellatospora citrea]